MRLVPRAAVLAIVVAVLGSGCGWAASPVPEDAERIGMVNATTTPVAVTVNGSWIGTYPGWSHVELPIHGHGGPPWTIAFETPHGDEIAELTIDDTGEHSSSRTSHSSPCGEFHAWRGAVPDDVPIIEGTTPPPVNPTCR